MAYEQYSNQAYQGSEEDIKKRISSNSNDISSEDVQFPNKLDQFVNKDNASLAGFTVVEEHILTQLYSSVLYLDHRPSVDDDGNISEISVSDGVINSGLTDIFAQTITFSTLPTADPFTVSYHARADKIQDSHVNALQNAVMAIENTLGVKEPVGNEGLGIANMSIVIGNSPATLADMTAITNFMPNAIFANDLSTDFKLGSTENALLPSNNVTIYIGTTGSNTRDNIVIDGDVITLQAQGGNNGGLFYLSTYTGDYIYISGCLEVASQTTIGMPGGACAVIQTGVPGGAQAFYDDAALRVHGGIWFGSGLSGNGDITFINTTGQAVDIQGNLIATTVTVNGTAAFHGVSTFNNLLHVKSPGFFRTNSDIVLDDKTNGTPAKIDGLDPSYAAAINNALPYIKGTVTESVRQAFDTNVSTLYVSGAARHHIHDFFMYPMLGGWMYTGLVNFEKAADGQHPNVVLLQASMTGLGIGYTNQPSLGGGTQALGDYSTGLFNPGDTYIEFDLPDGSASKIAYPVYYHEAFMTGGTATGINVYLATDQNALENVTLAGAKYRLFQPSNVRYQHINPDNITSFNSASAPTALWGNMNNDDYPYVNASALSYLPVAAGETDMTCAIYKQLAAGSSVEVDLTTALTRSLDGNTSYPQTGVAYIFATSRPGEKTKEAITHLRASPTPFGMLSQYVNTNGFNIEPGAEVPLGEIRATTSNGTNWTYLDSVSYMPGGFYDSCWVPITAYLATSIPAAIGRCLPFYGSTAGGGGGDEFQLGTDNHNFYVEHNIGPIRSLGQIDMKVYIAGYGTFGSNIYKSSSAGQMNLWSPHGEMYSNNTFISNYSGTKGFLKDITRSARIKMFDSRYALIGVDASESEFRGPTSNGNFAGYIRVIIKRAK